MDRRFRGASPGGIAAAGVLIASLLAARAAPPDAADGSRSPSISPHTAPSATSATAQPTPPAERIVETATRDDVRLTLALDGPPRVDAASWATLEIENLGASGVRWAGGGCGDPGSISIDLRPAFAPGRDWPGLLGRFKTAGLGDGFENPAAAFYVPADRFGQDIACALSLRVEELAPGAALELRAGWGGTFGGARAPAPTGPVVVSASFPFIGIAGEVANEDTDTDPIEVHISTTVAGVAGAAPLSPALAIDAALADPQFAAWVQASPEDRWINPSIDLLDGAWSIGLFRLGAGAQLDLYGAVTIDATGTIIGRRFDP